MKRKHAKCTFGTMANLYVFSMSWHESWVDEVIKDKHRVAVWWQLHFQFIHFTKSLLLFSLWFLWTTAGICRQQSDSQLYYEIRFNLSTIQQNIVTVHHPPVLSPAIRIIRTAHRSSFIISHYNQTSALILTILNRIWAVSNIWMH